MIARIRKSLDEKDQGFTLIELLVVMIIIGILAAIAIPVFLNQRKSAVDSSIKSDLRTVATGLETHFVDNQVYPAAGGGTGTIAVGSQQVTLSTGNVVNWTLIGTTGFCVVGSNPAGNAITAGTAPHITYNSLTGGLSTTAACP
ncbi:prepilin-type N-terminal cleavage/methylation domain-containing protein [Actinotalea sp. K2]|uniref:type II secretion system protein n=1 Tax=Actinotalea sp. K2 TaxID=2939438 RepID=UPI0027E1A725|nr:prepilin-type N-terminal cleavage/methylation domain-containing protein [Actinotalea sp. K2]